MNNEQRQNPGCSNNKIGMNNLWTTLKNLWTKYRNNGPKKMCTYSYVRVRNKTQKAPKKGVRQKHNVFKSYPNFG